MAIYHLSVKTVSRSAGRSATAAAAYRAGCNITDGRTGEIHDYTRKDGVQSATLIVPHDAPAWANDRELLWNAAEQAEKRKNSTVAREFEIALPSELSPAERQRLAEDFAQELVARHGCAADVAIHAPGREGDNRNHHAHILLTTRRLTPEGMGEKTRELDDQKTGKQLVTEWRERFATLQNEALRRAGHAVQVDHRSHAERGLEAEPTQHLGPTATAIERRTGQRSRIGQDFDQVVAERLRKAQEAGQLEEQGQAIDGSIIDLTGDLQAALQERDEAQIQANMRASKAQREEAERQRFEMMSSDELSEEIRNRRPPSVLGLVVHDSAVLRAEQKWLQLRAQQTEASSAVGRAAGQIEEWREAHKMQTWLHDKGIGHSVPLKSLEQQHEAQRVTLQHLGPQVDQARARLEHERWQAEQRISAEQAPARLRLAELEMLRQAKVQQELEQRQVEQRAEQEQAAVPEGFAAMARKREMREGGWSDRGEQWQAAPDDLKKLIEGYNAAPPEIREAMLESLSSSKGQKLLRDLLSTQHKDKDEGLGL